MTYRFARFGRYGFMVLAALIVLAGVVRSIMWGFIDFPCFATYNPDLDCIRDAYSDDAVGLRFEAYISVSQLGWNGAGCRYTPSSSSETHLETSTGPMVVKEVSGGLEINGDMVRPATEYVAVDYLNPDPWVVGRTRLDYVGYVRNCGDATGELRHVLIGATETAFGYEKGGAVLALLALGIWGLSRLEKRQVESVVT